MQQLFSKESFIHTAMGLRSGEDGTAGRKLWQDAWLTERQHSKVGSPSGTLGPSSAAVPPAASLLTLSKRFTIYSPKYREMPELYPQQYNSLVY